MARNSADRARLDLLRALDLPSGTRVELADSLGLGALDLPLDPDSAAAFAREHRAELAAERARTERRAAIARGHPARSTCRASA